MVNVRVQQVCSSAYKKDWNQRGNATLALSSVGMHNRVKKHPLFLQVTVMRIHYLW